MTGTESAIHWDGVYQTRAAESVSWFQATPTLSLSLIAAAAVAEPATARVIDIGGGASRLADALLDGGYRHLTVLDIAAPALEASRQRLGARAALVDWVVADITAWTPARVYDVWHDRAVFHFLTTAPARAAYRRALLAGTRPGSAVIVATFDLDGPERCSGLPVCRYAPETLAAELGADFVLEDQVREHHLTPAGAVQAFQFSRLRRL